MEGRLPHAALDIDGRWGKAQKIESILSAQASLAGSPRVLEIGTGSGAIAHYFARHSTLKCHVDAVDVVDQRQVSEGYSFELIADTLLPFENETFDVVISNHVIEHVGGALDQREHLLEISRVLKPDGIVYMAMPSRWQIVEPHYGLAFLSWLPVGMRTPYLRWRRKEGAYDCEPLSKRRFERLATSAGFTCANLFAEALSLFLADEKRSPKLAAWVKRFPATLFRPLEASSPTHVYLLRKQRNR